MTDPLAPPLAASYSTATAAAIAEFVAKTYQLVEPIECELLRRGFNDVFAVCAGDGQRYVLRMSGRRARGDVDVAAETAFLTYLDQQSVPVAAPVATRFGQCFSYAMQPEGLRPAVLFRYAEGRPPRPDDAADARVQGITLARIHDAAAEFSDRAAGRYRLDRDHLLNRPVAAISGLASLGAETRKRLAAVAQRLAVGIAAADELTWTRCHGDCHGFNARIAIEGPRAGQAVFFDFDDGGFGYLAYDLAVHLWAQTSFKRRSLPMWHSFIDGYRSVRDISQADFSATHYFVPVKHIWLIGEWAGRCAEWGTEQLPPEWLEREVTFLEEWESERLSGRLL
jgi:Ser/Thr protein kinase RdoA (MazF antagonist)